MAYGIFVSFFSTMSSLVRNYIEYYKHIEFVNLTLTGLVTLLSAPEYVEFVNPCQAPEVLYTRERPTLFSDCWSLGAVILHWMLELPPWDMQVQH